ncbi:MAG: DEAD/DEAH box helicase [Planctomycetota bacterium]
MSDADATLRRFHPCVRDWFRRELGEPTRAQKEGWPAIDSGESALLLAPTGSGKTLAAFLCAIDRLIFSDPETERSGTRVLYISPLKALASDVERNLRRPIRGITELATNRETRYHEPSVGIRTGDTTPRERERMRRHPPEILITTPESLYLILTSRAREMLGQVETVIIDEIHAMVASKRGTHLALSLERLEALRPSPSPVQRVGLSATQRPLDEVARFLGGGSIDAAGHWVARPVKIVDAGERKRIELSVEVDAENMARLDESPEEHSRSVRSADAASPDEEAPKIASIWPSIHRRLVALIKEHRSTLIFVNNRRLAERLAGALNDEAGDELALAHHGSLAHDRRRLIEDQLKRGDLPAMVATSSLELGIDMGAIDLVVQIESPPSVASGLQRIGRANHSVGEVPKGVVFPKFRADLLACAAASVEMLNGRVESSRYPRNPLDVLAQQLVAIVAMEPAQVEPLYEMVRCSAPFADLARESFESVLDMLSGRYPSDEFRDLRARLTWDRVDGVLHARAGAHRIAVTNPGTIPDRGLYGVFLRGAGDTKHRRVGELDEEMVFESKVGDVFTLGASSWRIDEITHDRVFVLPAPGELARMPFWHGDRPWRPLEFGLAIGRLTRDLANASDEEGIDRLTSEHHLGERAATNLVSYVRDQAESTGVVPTDECVVIERFVDDVGDWRICVLPPSEARSTPRGPPRSRHGSSGARN